MKKEQDRKDRVELAEHEAIARRLNMGFEEYVQKIIIPIHISGGMPIWGILRRTELWAMDRELGKNWWRQENEYE